MKGLYPMQSFDLKRIYQSAAFRAVFLLIAVAFAFTVFAWLARHSLPQLAISASTSVNRPGNVDITSPTQIPVAAVPFVDDQGNIVAAIPDPLEYKHNGIPTIGNATGTYTGEFSSGTEPNVTVNPARLPSRPFLGTELYWVKNDANSPDTEERQWLKDLQLDFLRVLVSPEDVGKGQSGDAYPNTDFTRWRAGDFENGRGWHFNSKQSTLTNVVSNLDLVRFPIMMMMHYGGENYMGSVPNSDEYAEYFLATVYYYNVVKKMNIKYWEVLNEPDWGWNNTVCTPDQYAEIFKKVAERIKSFPDPRVNSIRLGGPSLGSGDPIDGYWPDGYPNRDKDGERQWRDYVPRLLQQGSRDNQHDIGFLSWHDYGDRWGWPNNIYNFDQNYALVNRVNAFYDMLNPYVASGGDRPQLAVTEMNFDAGTPDAKSAEYYKNFYTTLWHTSTLNNYFSTGKLTMLSYFFWKGDAKLPKGLVYSGPDTNDKTVRTPTWWAYSEYIQHTQEKILASSNGKVDRWADAIVTTDKKGKVMNLIAVNKFDRPRTVDFSFDVPDSLLGKVAISKRTMQAGGTGTYGEPFHEPKFDDPYQWQSVTFESGKQVHYQDTIPPHTVVCYTIVKADS